MKYNVLVSHPDYEFPILLSDNNRTSWTKAWAVRKARAWRKANNYRGAWVEPEFGNYCIAI